MSGYIEYVDTSILSPVYPHSLEIGGTIYPSAHEAIQSGEDPTEVMLLHVRNNKNIYNKYRNYIFSGTHADLLNKAINTLLIPKREPIDIGRYIYVITGNDLQKAIALPTEFSIRIIRSIYVTSHVNSNIYRQSNILPALEEYNVFMLENIPLYVGKMGAFFLLEEREQSVSSALQRLRQ